MNTATLTQEQRRGIRASMASIESNEVWMREQGAQYRTEAEASSLDHAYTLLGKIREALDDMLVEADGATW